MFTTIEQVKELTAYDVTQEQIIMAQALIETYVGRLEVQVLDPDDFALLTRATAYQAAYMVDNSETIFQQISVASIGQFGQMVTFKSDSPSPYISELAVYACRRLSWKRMRSVFTGSIFASPVVQSTWRTE